MTDEEAAVIDAARAVDALLWLPDTSNGIPLADVHATVQGLHDAILRLDRSRPAPVIGA